jgi:hypothetical protein
MLVLLALLPLADGPVVTVGSRSAMVPAGWTAEKPANRLRSHQLKLPSPDPALAAGELVVFPDSDPNPDKVFPRWAATVEPPDGVTPEANAKRSKSDANGLTLHRLDVSGTWKYKEFPQAKKEERRPNWRVVWVIAAEKGSATHLRLSGPAAVVEKHLPAFDRWLEALAPDRSPKR